jgi:subtilisin family serine protease
MLAGCQAPLAGTAISVAGDRFAAMAAPSATGPARVNLQLPGASEATLRELGRKHHLTLSRTIPQLGAASFVLSGASSADLEALSREPGVQFVERDAAGHLIDAARPPVKSGVPDYGDQWDMQHMRVGEALRLRQGSDHTVVGMIDTGMDLGHPELQPKIVGGTSITSPNDAPQDDLGHGTATAGIVGAQPVNGQGLTGVAPKARLLAVKVNEPGTGHVTASATAAGIVWAVDHGANVLNMSIGFTAGEDGLTGDALKTLNQAVSYALGKGVLVVCAAGNTSGQPETDYPAVWSGTPGFEGLIAVGALDSNDQRTGYSNTGPWLTVTAPAEGCPALAIGGFGSFGGTSAAAPHVAGLAALLITPSRPPSVKNLRTWITKTARDLGAKGFDQEYGYGCVDALAAIQASAL